MSEPDRSFSSMVNIFFKGVKEAQKNKTLSLDLRKQFLQKIISIPNRFKLDHEKSSKTGFSVSRIEFDKTVLRVQRLFYSQDLYLEAYSKLFSRYHPKPHQFYVFRPSITQKAYQKTQKDFKKVLDTIQLRERRIEKF